MLKFHHEKCWNLSTLYNKNQATKYSALFVLNLWNNTSQNCWKSADKCWKTAEILLHVLNFFIFIGAHYRLFLHKDSDWLLFVALKSETYVNKIQHNKCQMNSALFRMKYNFSILFVEIMRWIYISSHQVLN